MKTSGRGGSRIYLEDKVNNSKRDLICDTYGNIDEPESQELKELIFETIRKYLEDLK